VLLAATVWRTALARVPVEDSKQRPLNFKLTSDAQWVSNSSSCSDWELDEAPAVGDPPHMAEIGSGDRASIGEHQWRIAELPAQKMRPIPH
jgi:hypothetical protein